VLGELLPEDVYIGGLAREPITILHKNEVDTADRNQVPQIIETGSGEARTGGVVLELTGHLVTVRLAVLSQGFALLT
jgi:hypothetical protein